MCITGRHLTHSPHKWSCLTSTRDSCSAACARNIWDPGLLFLRCHRIIHTFCCSRRWCSGTARGDYLRTVHQTPRRRRSPGQFGTSYSSSYSHLLYTWGRAAYHPYTRSGGSSLSPPSWLEYLDPPRLVLKSSGICRHYYHRHNDRRCGSHWGLSSGKSCL